MEGEGGNSAKDKGRGRGEEVGWMEGIKEGKRNEQ